MKSARRCEQHHLFGAREIRQTNRKLERPPPTYPSTDVCGNFSSMSTVASSKFSRRSHAASSASSLVAYAPPKLRSPEGAASAPVHSRATHRIAKLNFPSAHATALPQRTNSPMNLSGFLSDTKFSNRGGKSSTRGRIPVAGIEKGNRAPIGGDHDSVR